ncbi:MAG TPA: transglutaminaseTgpA domain-containing protein [Bryobacteraceae bacterium]|nr:transglutaminaseTgpA domain-containing protein [Bryobacteraceae bacterium]
MTEGAAGAGASITPLPASGALSPANWQLDRFFELSLLGLLASGFFAVAGSGYLDMPTLAATAAALLVRVMIVAGLIHFDPPPAAVTIVTLAYVAFWPIDYFFISRFFIPAAIHLVFFVAVVKIVTARSDRDYLFLKVIALLELLAACIVSSSFNFFVFLLLFLVLGVATFASSEIRQSRKRGYSPGRISGAAVIGRLTGVVVAVSLAILTITAGLFFFLPRTARAAFQHLVSHRYHLVGFSNHVTLGEIGEIKQENVPVMHVKMEHPEDRALSLKWRGAALTEFNGRAWFNRTRPGQVLQPDGAKLLRLDSEASTAGGRYISYAVYLNDLAQDALFFAGTPQFLRIDSTVLRRPDANYSVQFPESRTVSYQVFSFLESPTAALDPALVNPLAPTDRQAHLQLPHLDPRIPALAKSVVAGEQSQDAQARTLEKYLRTNYGYTLELPKTEPEDPLAFFLFHRRKGHCEYFASAMAVMLRTIGIPSRVITGFQSGVYNPISGSQLIRSSDAHSWVEAWLPDHGWTTFDPTPPDPNAAHLSPWTRLGFYTDAVDVFWQDWVLNYNLERQLQLASRVGESGRHFGANWTDVPRWRAPDWGRLRDFSVALLGFVALAFLAKFLKGDGWRWWKMRRRMMKAQRGEAHPSDATLLYERMLKALRRRGIEKPAWLTPCEFAHVLQEPDLSLLVEDFTAAYNELRFGGNAEAAGRAFLLLERLESVP